MWRQEVVPLQQAELGFWNFSRLLSELIFCAMDKQKKKKKKT